MTNPIVLKRTDSVGAADAESDEGFLKQCFVDSGQLDILLDCKQSPSIILGRTGSGKTALLLEVKRRVEHAIELSPEALSLNFLINSNVLNFFEEAGVHLDAFYKLLWQHVFCVELIRSKYNIKNEEGQAAFWSMITELFNRDRAKEEAMRYLQKWGPNFWEETTTRVKEFTRRVEYELSTTANVDMDLVKLGAKGVAKLSDQEKAEAVDHGQRVVNNVHIQDLIHVIRLLRENIFDDPKQPFYIVIDRLDENWADDRIRFKLIRALIEAVRSFRQVRHVKILVAMRTDLLFTVLYRNTQSGFQTEKYESLYSRVRWSRELLVHLLDLRTSAMLKRRYSGQVVRLEHILPPNQIEQRSAIDYLLDRTFFRPREAILFLNDCINRADGRARITVELLRAAEGLYSTKRMASLAEEWAHEYPQLRITASILSKRYGVFPLSNIVEEDANRVMISLLDRGDSPDPMVSSAKRYLNVQSADYRDFVRQAVCIMYQTGLVGVKLAPNQPVFWSYLDEPVISEEKLTAATDIHVHKTFWQALNVTNKHSRGATSRQ